MTKDLAFNIASEMARFIDAGISGDEMVSEMRCMFPTAKAADYDRAKLIGLERVEMLEGGTQAAIHNLADLWLGGAPKEAIDAAIQQVQMLPSAERLFPAPDRPKAKRNKRMKRIRAGSADSQLLCRP
jgi:hypothetical protein